MCFDAQLAPHLEAEFGLTSVALGGWSGRRTLVVAFLVHTALGDTLFPMSCQLKRLVGFMQAIGYNFILAKARWHFLLKSLVIACDCFSSSFSTWRVLSTMGTAYWIRNLSPSSQVSSCVHCSGDKGGFLCACHTAAVAVVRQQVNSAVTFKVTQTIEQKEDRHAELLPTSHTCLKSNQATVSTRGHMSDCA